MAVTDLVVLTRLGRDALFGLLRLGGVEQCRDDGSRADAHRDPGLDQFGAPFFVPLVAIAHHILFLLLWRPSYALASVKGRVVR